MHVTGRNGVKVELLQGLTEAYSDMIVALPRETIGRMFARMELALVRAGAFTEDDLCAEHGLVPWREPEPPALPAPAAEATS